MTTETRVGEEHDDNVNRARLALSSRWRRRRNVFVYSLGRFCFFVGSVGTNYVTGRSGFALVAKLNAICQPRESLGLAGRIESTSRSTEGLTTVQDSRDGVLSSFGSARVGGGRRGEAEKLQRLTSDPTHRYNLAESCVSDGDEHGAQKHSPNRFSIRNLAPAQVRLELALSRV